MICLLQSFHYWHSTIWDYTIDWTLIIAAEYNEFIEQQGFEPSLPHKIPQTPRETFGLSTNVSILSLISSTSLTPSVTPSKTPVAVVMASKQFNGPATLDMTSSSPVKLVTPSVTHVTPTTPLTPVMMSSESSSVIPVPFVTPSEIPTSFKMLSKMLQCLRYSLRGLLLLQWNFLSILYCQTPFPGILCHQKCFQTIHLAWTILQEPCTFGISFWDPAPLAMSSKHYKPPEMFLKSSASPEHFPKVMRCFQWFLNALKLSECLRIFSIIHNSSDTVPALPNSSETSPVLFKCSEYFQCFPIVLKCLQCFPTVLRHLQCFPTVLACFPRFQQAIKLFNAV